MNNPPSTDDYLTRVTDTIERHGWAVQGVLPNVGDTDPPFSYTVGLTNFGHPEIIVFGVDPRDAGIALLNNLGERVRAGRSFSHGEVPRNLLSGGYEPILISVLDLSRLTVAQRIYESITALQLVLPDKGNRLPWHAGYTMDWQPVLGPGTVRGNT